MKASKNKKVIGSNYARAQRPDILLNYLQVMKLSGFRRHGQAYF